MEQQNQIHTGEPDAMTKLAAALMAKMRQISAQPAVLDFGSILNDFSLSTNRFPIPIPQGDYFVCRIGALSFTQGLGQTKTADLHSHEVPLPACLEPIQPGDRVLIAWVDDDAVVIDKFMPATVVEVRTDG